MSQRYGRATRRKFIRIALCVLAVALWMPAAQAQEAGTWGFAVSGDSRNCGDVVVPGIAANALRHRPSFFWHLGDFRWVSNFDQDMQHQPVHQAKLMTVREYLDTAWQDFLDNQVASFGSLPVFLTIGNHELIPPKTRDEFIAQFGDWLTAPVLRQQRRQDDPRDYRVKTYAYWIERGVDFINLDNASPDQFDKAQVAWFERVLASAASNSAVKTVVVGMHIPLPDSIAADHSMSEFPVGVESGRRVYADLVKFRQHSGKRVYILASHVHYFMDGIFNTEYWRTHGGVLPGWIVGTAGAERYALPPNSKDARAAETNVYGYLLGTVRADGEIEFTFQRLSESEIPAAVKSHYNPEFVHWCFAENTRARP